MTYMNDPMGIENRSFEIIAEELAELGDYPFTPEEFKVVQRVIHTTADFEYADLVGDPEVREEAGRRGVTRSTVAMERACEQEIRIFAIGNAPTALFTLMELMRKKDFKPDLIIGVPVGFVGAAESKEELLTTDASSISIQGRKGGSTVTVAILNALFYLLNNER